MLTKITVENFKSFDKTTELTMISSSKIRLKPGHKMEIGNTVKLLKHAAIYGANASGKTNLVEFFEFFHATLENGIPFGTNHLFCRTKKENEMKPSVFEMQIEINGKFYAYGFAAILSIKRITEEWLYELHTNGSAELVFSREEDSQPKMNPKLKLSEEDEARFRTYAYDFQDNTTSLFLTEMNRGKKYKNNSKLRVFKLVYDWLTTKIIVISPNHIANEFEYYFEEESLSLVSNLISSFDTGISGIHTQELDISELPKFVPEAVISQVKDNMQNANFTKFQIAGRANHNIFNLEIEEGKEPKLTTIKLKHGSSIFDFDFAEESDGTKRLFDLIDMLLLKGNDTVFVVDELDRSLHPKLTEKFIELFSKKHENEKIQLIFTTHEASILDENLLRRDEIWFIERDKDNSSKLYPLDQFKERYDKKLSKAYLEGRYGAIPVFQDFSFRGEDA